MDFPEPQCVRNDGDRAERHCSARNHRVEEPSPNRVQNAGGNRYAENVVDESEEQILAYIAHRRVAEDACAQNATEIAFDQCDVRRFYCHIGSGSHSNADIRLSQGWSIIDPIARHCDDLTTLLKLLYNFSLRVGQHFGLDVINADLPCHCLSRRSVLTRHHNVPDLFAMQIADRFRCRFPNWIGDADQSCKSPVEDHEHYRLAFVPKHLRWMLNGTRINAALFQKRAISNCDRTPIDCSAHTFARKRANV